jgi:hypothetical protein
MDEQVGMADGSREPDRGGTDGLADEQHGVSLAYLFGTAAHVLAELH